MTAPTDIDAIRAAFQADLEGVVSDQDLQTVRDRYLGRKQGALAALMVGHPVEGKGSGEHAITLK